MDDTIQLGGNIELSGFREIDGSSMIVLKKIVGNYVKRMSELSKNLERVCLTMKMVHATPHGGMYNIHAKMIQTGKSYVSEVTERNLFVAVDNALKKIINEIS